MGDVKEFYIDQSRVAQDDPGGPGKGSVVHLDLFQGWFLSRQDRVRQTEAENISLQDNMVITFSCIDDGNQE